MCFSVRKTTIGQKLPDDWKEKAIRNTEALRNKMLDAGVDVLIKADQKFVQFYSERQYVLSPTGISRVEGKIKENVK